MSLRGETPRRFAYNSVQVVAALDRRDVGAAAVVELSRGPVVEAASVATASAAARAGTHLCGAPSLWLGARLIGGETGHPHATVWRALRRAGISRPARQPRERPQLYEWPCPGDLLHIDSKRFVRFSRPGRAVTGDRRRSGREKRLRIGYEWVHSIVDDHSRYAYSELHRDERAATVTAFVERALAHFTEQGIESKQLLSDNAWSYRHNRSLRELLQARGIKHRFIRPRRPQTNGTVERYQQTLKREWGLGRVHRSSDHRAAALSHWLDYYNRGRPHSSLGGRSPISRVHNLPRQDT